MQRTDLSQHWTMQAEGDSVPPDLLGRTVTAQVPGSAHTDLMREGLMVDPYLGLNELAVEWVHRADFTYQRSIDIPRAARSERVDLVFEGLDTVASIAFGDREIGQTRNQHRTYRFDVRDDAGQGPVPLSVVFSSALVAAEAEEARIGKRSRVYPTPMNMIRKMACSFGWDWGPNLQTAGLWRPVSLERWSIARLSSARPLVTVGDSHDQAQVAVHVDIERSGLEGTDVSPVTVSARLSLTDTAAAGAERHVIEATATIAPGESSGVVLIDVPNPELWWPVGHGDQPLYDLHVNLAAGSEEGDADEVDATKLDEWHRRVGLRSVHLDTSTDDDGTAFVIQINGRPIFVKGANWIPDDHLLTRITRERLAKRVGQAVDANLNLLRVWGGGIYESRDFYELCDEAGVMVWQDFLLACAAYPEEEPHRSEWEAEAREHVARLTAHPSLVLWNGGNENIWGHEDWDWKDDLGEATWGAGYYYDLFPKVVAELDPTRPYAAGSPYSPGATPEEIRPNDPNHGTHHQWEVWNRIDYTHYRDDIPRFCSEFGFQGPPSWHASTRAMSNPDGTVATKEDDVFLLHQKADDGNAKLDGGLAPHIGVPEDFADWHFATQLNQARAVAHALTHYRSWWPRTAGAIVWQFNDCWPVTSWGAVDGDEIAKPLWWALRASFADRLVTVQERTDAATGDKHLVVAVVNDTDAAWSGQLDLRREQLNGDVVARAEVPFEAPARGVAIVELPKDVAVTGDPTREVLIVEADGSQGAAATTHFWAEDIELLLDADPPTVEAEATADGYAVTVTAHRSLVKDLILFVDRLDPAATVDSALITLPAGTSTVVSVRSSVAGLADALTQAPVLRTANDLVAIRLSPAPL